MNIRTASPEERPVWQKLYDLARDVRAPRQITQLLSAGEVGAAVMTDSGTVYTGVCIDTACGLGMCAERNAMASMLTCGEHKIRKVAAVMPDGRSGSPCGACREFMMQLGEDASEIQILVDIKNFTFVTLDDITPDWWGNENM